MIDLDEARSAVLDHAEPLPATKATLESALGCVLALPICTMLDLPSFDNSAVDGFGVHVDGVAGASEGSPIRLELAGTVRAGEDVSGVALSKGKALKIMTGAPVPADVEAVIMREYCREEGEFVHIQRPAKPGENIRRKGEEFQHGQQVLDAGTRVTPAVVGMLATVGLTEVEVHRKPRVAVLVTGDELVKPGTALKPGQIYESNSFALAAILREMGIDDVQLLHLRDEREAITEGIRESLDGSDVLITVGGVSVGDFDYVKEAMADLGVEQIFWKINMKPGKPNFVGVYRKESGADTLVFGLPGNPVSAQVSFHHLVKPAILKMIGVANVARQGLLAELAADIQHKPGRREFLRGVLEMNQGHPIVRPVSGQGSHMQGGLARANCLIDVPPDCPGFKQGEQVFVELLTWR
ncbi:MAG: molybdopterin molybdotransferase MoeA [Planctomycetes bacterium]|nr:molybdopterin molybdotransferase MoeA [Planctomycetota bacterium]